jgi:hypothetical protein
MFAGFIKVVRETPSYFWILGFIAVAVDAWWDGWLN